MGRPVLRLTCFTATTLFALVVGGYACFVRPSAQAPSTPQPTFDTARPLPKNDEFEALAKTDPVAMLETCLARYLRETNGGFTATQVVRERVKGDPEREPREEIISLFVRGDVPDSATGKPCIEVLMRWESGARSVLGSEITAVLYSGRPGSEGTSGKVVAWRPTATVLRQTSAVADASSARANSRYCIRDAGVYRSMLRTYLSWKHCKEVGVLATEYRGKWAVPEVGGRICHVVERTCPTPEVDAYEIGGAPDTDPKVIAREGFSRVRVMIDAETWLQVGTEHYRPDGQLLAAYYFRHPNTTPTFEPDTFTVEGMKKE